LRKIPETTILKGILTRTPLWKKLGNNHGKTLVPLRGMKKIPKGKIDNLSALPLPAWPNFFHGNNFWFNFIESEVFPGAK